MPRRKENRDRTGLTKLQVTSDEAGWMLGMSEGLARQLLDDMGFRPVVQRHRLVLWDVRDVVEARDNLRAAAGLPQQFIGT